MEMQLLRNILLSLLLLLGGNVVQAAPAAINHGKQAFDQYNQFIKDVGSLTDPDRISRERSIIAEAEKGVIKNDRLAMALIGVFLQSGWKVGDTVILAMDRDRAFSLLRKSYDMGEVEAANGLVKAYANGWGVPRDRALASTLVQEAIAKGCPDCTILQAELNRGSGPSLEFHPEQAVGCTLPKDKKRMISKIEVPCNAGSFSGYGSIHFSRNKNKELCIFTGYVLNGLEQGAGQWDCEVEGRKFTVPRLINGRITLVQDEIIGGKYVTKGNFEKGKLDGFGEVSGPQGLFVSGDYKENNLQKGYQILSSSYEKHIAVLYDKGVSFAKCTSDYDQAIDQNCGEENRKIIFPAAVAAREVKMAVEAKATGAVTATGQILAPPINCADFAYSKTTALPTASSGQNALCTAIRDKLGSSQFRFLSFQKIDGLSSVVNGVSIYTMQYEAEIEYTADLRPECFENMAFMKYPQCGETISFGGITARGNALPTVAPAGVKIKRKGDINFTKYESGWKWSPPSGL
jgi:hypothetical protein